jgi:hypothetical protein
MYYIKIKYFNEVDFKSRMGRLYYVLQHSYAHTQVVESTLENIFVQT